MALQPAQFELLHAAIRDAFTANRLELMLYTRLGRRLDEITATADLKTIVFNLLRDAEMNGYVLPLLVAARQSNPGNEKLYAAAREFGLTAVDSAMERKVSELPFVDIAPWRSKLGAIEAQVCRVETGTSYGTGFLVGPSTVLTNFHVVEDVIKSPGSSAGVVLRFDYKRSSDGTTLHPGTEVRLASKDWLIDSSPFSSADDVDDPTRLPGAEELDYALLRVEGEPGNLPVSAPSAEVGAVARGFVKLPIGAVKVAADQPILIVQHPKGDPLKLALDTKAIESVNANRTRVRYRTNTEGGSSGSPVFDVNWNLLAIHHWGDPDAKPAAPARWNQGVPIDAIVALLTRRGHSASLGRV